MRTSIQPSGDWYQSTSTGSKIISIAAFIAIVFNKGYSLILKMMYEVDINIGPECQHFADMYDQQRISR